MNDILLNFIVVLHIFFIIFVIITPFIGNNYFLLIHSIVIPFIMLHWYANDNTCCLTLMESNIRHHLYGEYPNPNNCFTYKLIAPIYDFQKDNSDSTYPIYIVTIVLWLISLSKLYLNWSNGKLSSIEDLLRH